MGTQRGGLERRGGAGGGGGRALAPGATGGGRRDRGAKGRDPAGLEASRPGAPGPRAAAHTHPARPRLRSSCGGRRRARGGVSTLGPLPCARAARGAGEDNPRARRRAAAG
jgi:hypothetical protein